MFVVTLPKSASHDPASYVRKAKRAGANVLEIRTDITPDIKSFRSSLPLLLALRGKNPTCIARFKPAYLDLETTEEVSPALIPRGTKIIRSFHDYEGTPSLKRLHSIANRMRASLPWAVKIAVTVTKYEDLLILQTFSRECATSKQRVIILGMGPMAHLSRMLSPLTNMFTYACLEQSDASASGQLPLALYSLTAHVRKPKIFAVVGGPHIASSLSPMIQNALFKKHGIDAVYSCFPATDFSSVMRLRAKLGISGFSVTAPFKHDALKTAHSVDAIASALGAANTLVFKKQELCGYNTDGIGIEHGYPFLSRAKHIAILGAGGAVPSVIVAARHLSPDSEITIYARDPRKASRDLQEFGVSVRPLSFIKKAQSDAVICAISQDVPLLLPKAKGRSVAIDLRYGIRTKFMKEAEKKGYVLYDGLPMLMHQGLKQFEYFSGKKTGTSDIALLRKILRPFLLTPHGK